MKLAKQIACGTIAALAVYLAMLALLSLLLVRGTVAESGVGLYAWTSACVAAYTGAKLAARGAGEEGKIPAVLCAMMFWCVVVLLGFLTNDMLEVSRAALLGVAALTGGAASCLIAGRGGKRKRRRHYHK